MKKHYGFWLMLDKESEDKFQQIINFLSEFYNEGKTFVPHLSVHPSIHADIEEIKQHLESRLDKQLVFTAKTEGIGTEDRWSKTLYARIEKVLELANINDYLVKAFAEYTNDESIQYDPHISLLYKSGLSLEQKQDLIDQVEIPISLSVRSLAVVDPGVDDDNWKDYTKWKVIYELPFFNHAVEV